MLYAADPNGENWKALDPTVLGGKFSPLMFSPDDQHLFAYLAVNGGPSMLVKSNPSGGNQQVLTKDAFSSVGGMEWGPLPAQPFAVTLGEASHACSTSTPVMRNPNAMRHWPTAFPASTWSMSTTPPTAASRCSYVYSDRDPGAWYLHDRQHNRASKLLERHPGLDPARMGERRPFRFRASDGLELDGYLTLPNGVDDPARLPMVLLPHGGPHGVGDDWGFDGDAQFLASRGYLVLQVNFRGSKGRGYAFEQAGFRQCGGRVQDDLLDAVRWTIAQGYVDPARVCSYGASFGAYSAMMVAAKAPELFKCTAGLAGLYDLKMMYSKGDIRHSRYGRSYLARAIGNDDAELEANSATTQAARIKVPVLLVHGELDERTPLAQAKAMKAALERAGNAPEWLVVPKEGHGFYKDQNNIAFYQRLQALLDRHIGAAAAR